jgi:nucleolar protein 53
VLDLVPDADLFYIDKGPAEPTAAPPTRLSRKELARSKTLRSQVILEAAHRAQPLSGRPPRKHKPPTAALPSKTGVSRGKQPNAINTSLVPAQRPASAAPPATTDLWDRSLAPPSKRPRTGPRRPAPALEIDLPGCSFNPDVEQHQDAMAVAVAAEMRKVYKKVRWR